MCSQTRIQVRVTNIDLFIHLCSNSTIHLELVNDLNVSSFLRAFRRFCGRRGLPVTLISDNAKTFKAASKEVSGILRAIKC